MFRPIARPFSGPRPGQGRERISTPVFSDQSDTIPSRTTGVGIDLMSGPVIHDLGDRTPHSPVVQTSASRSPHVRAGSPRRRAAPVETPGHAHIFSPLPAPTYGPPHPRSYEAHRSSSAGCSVRRTRGWSGSRRCSSGPREPNSGRPVGEWQYRVWRHVGTYGSRRRRVLLALRL